MDVWLILHYFIPSWAELATSLASALTVALLAFLISQSPQAESSSSSSRNSSLTDDTGMEDPCAAADEEEAEEVSRHKQQAVLAAALKAEGVPISVPVRQVGRQV